MIEPIEAGGGRAEGVTSSGLRTRSVEAIGSSATLAAFRVPGYPALWLSEAASGFGRAATQVAIGWMALVATDSILAVGATFAARLVPALLLGIPLGGLVDRYDRRSTLIVVNLAAIIPLSLAAAAGATGAMAITGLLLLSLALGVIDTLQGTATQTYSFDLAGASGATNAIALGNLGVFLAGAVGSIASGVALDRLGAASPFILSAVTVAIAVACLVLGGGHARRERPAAHLAPSFKRSMTLILRNRRAALIALVVVTCEVLGFSSITVFPTFTRDVLGSDAAGLGALATARQLGAIAALLLLARMGVARSRGGRLLLAGTLAIGLGLLAFALSTSFAVSFLVLVLVGAAMASQDTLGQLLLQRNVEDAERGSAMGIWFFSIGFGLVGLVGLGAAASAIGAQAALAIDGALLALFAIGLARVKALHELV
ncbi:MAG: MFS transporter [Chloroflexota bacterium]